VAALPRLRKQTKYGQSSDNMTKKKTKQILRIVLLIGTIVSLFYVPFILVKAWLLPLPDTVQEQVNEAVGHGLDGMIVYVDEAEKPPAFYAAGWHDRKNKIPADPHALFKIASISKLYDAVAIAKLVKAKRLSLDKTLADYFPELVGRIENAESITLKMMVQHRSGIPNFTDTPGFWANPAKSNAEALELVLDLPANFEPDKDYEYSNTNYLLISELIAKVVSYNKFQYIQEEILNPLGLDHTFASLSDVDIHDVMSGYYVGYEADLKTDEYGMLATAEDVGIFLRALNDGSLFNEGEQEIYSSIYVYQHTGWVPGYQSIANYHKDIDTIVIQFNNTTGGYHWNTAEILYSRIVKILRHKKTPNK
jgi:D-alanyl-D-alanine carboxypeptidase